VYVCLLLMMVFNGLVWNIVAGFHRWGRTHITSGIARTMEDVQIVHPSYGKKMASYCLDHFVSSSSFAALNNAR